MDQANAGQFMTPAGGGGDALQEAMARRGMGGPGVANQTTQPGGVLPSQAPPMPSASPIPTAMQGSQAPVQDPNQPAPHGNNPEIQIILKAMAQYMNGASKVHQAQNGVS